MLRPWLSERGCHVRITAEENAIEKESKVSKDKYASLR